MSLEKRLSDILLNTEYDNRYLSECVQICDEFAVGFAYWCEWREDRAFKTYDELLEIYKQGL